MDWWMNFYNVYYFLQGAFYSYAASCILQNMGSEFVNTMFDWIVSRILYVVIGIILVRYYVKLTSSNCMSTRSLHGRTVIITGATSGIGKEIALQVAQRGARVILTCRDKRIGLDVKDDIREITGNKQVLVKKLDLTSETSIRKFATDIILTEKYLDILVHNAGIAIFSSNQVPSLRTENDVELTMATNHFGPFLLTHLLIDHMKKSAIFSPGRIIIVASDLYKFAASVMRLNNINPGSFFPAKNYCISKYVNICFTLELADRLLGCNITANCLHPGMVDTPMWKKIPSPFSWLMSLIVKYYFKTIKEGVQTAMHLICSSDVEFVTGKYFKECKETKLSFGADSMIEAEGIWEESLKFVNLKDTDPKI